THTARQCEPRREWPEEELQRDGRPDRGRRLDQSVAKTPRRRDQEEQQRTDRPEVDRAAREQEDARERVAAPVADLEQPQGGPDGRDRDRPPQDRSDARVEWMQRRNHERQQRRVRVGLAGREDIPPSAVPAPPG